MEEKNNIDHYAKALFSIWNEFDEQNKIQFTNWIKEVYFSIKNNFAYISIISSNILTKKEKKTLIQSSFGEMNLNKKNLPQIYLYNFLFVLIDNDFFAKILEIIICFFEKLDDFQNFTFLRIYSPFEIDKEILKKIEGFFVIKTGKKIRYENIIDRNLIGGMKIAFGNEVYDYSIKGKINQIKWNIENFDRLYQKEH
ncbi:MAG: ATP synthase F1 subunit delta [Malacoplasma sp.]|nr:ATP synthase F1 subunit delta [Malacoplasma sp.]